MFSQELKDVTFVNRERDQTMILNLLRPPPPPWQIDNVCVIFIWERGRERIGGYLIKKPGGVYLHVGDGAGAEPPALTKVHGRQLVEGHGQPIK